MKSLRGIDVVAVCGAFVVGGVAFAQDADCNVNGIPDAAEIAAGLVGDCNGNGVPDPCEYAGVLLEAEQSGFGGYPPKPLVRTFSGVGPAVSDVRFTIEARADLDAEDEFVIVKVGDTVVATLWASDGDGCPSTPQVQTLIVSMATLNSAIVGGEVTISLEPSKSVTSYPDFCPASFAWLNVEYVSDLLPDCDGNLVWDTCELLWTPELDCDANSVLDSCDIAATPGIDCDGNGEIDSCEIAATPSLDCDRNGLIDHCEIERNPGIDCDENGQLDCCDIAANSSLDCNSNGSLDACELASESFGLLCEPDCDGDGIHDACQILADPALDKNSDGILDACQYARGDLNLDRTVDGADLAYMLGVWGATNPTFDLTDDGLIDGADLAELLGHWGETLLRPDCLILDWAEPLEVMPDPAVITDPQWRVRIIATGLPWRVQDNTSGIEMILVPPGTFMMGCSASDQNGCGSPEAPVHEVTLTRAFYLGRYEVTQAQWAAVMGSNPSHFQSASAEVPAEQVSNRPVEKVSWDMIQGFEAQTGLRLPTEAEWEYACRAGTQTAFNLPPNGTDDDNHLGLLAWYGSSSGGNAAAQTHPVGQKLANNLGLHDMHGNVHEWVEDWYGATYYSVSPPADPPGPENGSQRASRGGIWAAPAGLCRASFRSFNAPTSSTSMWRGFRVARTPAAPVVDGDGDGYASVDCGGTDCDDGNPDINPGMTEVCGNGIDDDCNGLIDCEDPACLGSEGCDQPFDWATVIEPEPDPAVITSVEWRERIIATGLPWRVRDNASGIEMLLIPAGTFMMGCSPSDLYGCYSHESPVHEVTLTQPFYLGRYEVTQAQWTAVTGSNPSAFQSASDQVPSDQVPNRPVEAVSWNMIQGFEAQTGLRLPTEAEWEYACRAGTTTAFNLSPDGTNDDGLLGQLAWFSSNAFSQTHPVGQKQANNLGLHDMHGNVWEWVEDWYGSGYYAESPAVDPPGPTSGTKRLLRGGSYYYLSVSCRASHRSYPYPSTVSADFGLRAARTP